MTIKYLLILLLATFLPEVSRAEVTSPSLSDLLERAYKNNSALNAQYAEFESEESLLADRATPEDPMIGISTLDRGNETQYGTISQKFRFPVKYYLQGKAQGSRAEALRARFIAKKYEVRMRIITLYYSIFSSQKAIQLTEANMQAVREFSIVASKKYAAGKASQGDSMKAHFELTQLELELLRMKQEESALQDALRAELNDQAHTNLIFGHNELSVPTYDSQPLSLSISDLHKQLIDNSPKLKDEVHQLNEAEWNSKIAKWDFAPDFQIQYQKRISGMPEDSDILSVNMSVPLWFWKKSSATSSASSKKMAQEYRVRSATDLLIAKVKDLKGKVETGVKTLDIYKTSLIPQALGAYNSSRSAYRANKTSFLDLLDSERSLYRVKTGYYKSFKQYVEDLAALEAELGFSVSNIESYQIRGAK
ncbi:MAG: TolC family protein [Bdellovibrionales bacterium]|nr:TolC family protein [Bdellovibrionales bacterium]